MYFEVYKSGDEWRWRLKAGNHEIIANGGEGFTTKAACLKSIDLVRKADADTPVKEKEAA